MKYDCNDMNMSIEWIVIGYQRLSWTEKHLVKKIEGKMGRQNIRKNNYKEENLFQRKSWEFLVGRNLGTKEKPWRRK